MPELITLWATPIHLGLTAAALSLFAFVPYMRDTITGATQPQRASWLIWSVLSVIAFLSQLYEGATVSLWFAGSQMAATVTIFLLSVRFGQGVYVSRWDERVLWVAVIGLLLWYFTETAIYALALSITISLLGGTLTVAKAWKRPGSETLLTWSLSWVASLFAFASVTTWDAVLLAYPIYILVLNTLIISAVLGGRMRIARRFPTRAMQ